MLFLYKTLHCQHNAKQNYIAFAENKTMSYVVMMSSFSMRLTCHSFRLFVHHVYFFCLVGQHDMAHHHDTPPPQLLLPKVVGGCLGTHVPLIHENAHPR